MQQEEITPVIARIYSRLAAERDAALRAVQTMGRVDELRVGQLRQALWALEQAVGPDHPVVVQLKEVTR